MSQAQAYLEEDFNNDFDDEHLQMNDAGQAEYDLWFREKVEAGERAYREGRYVTQDEASLQALERRERLLASLPK